MTGAQVIAVIAAPFALALTIGVVAFVRPAMAPAAQPATVPSARVERVSRWERHRRAALLKEFRNSILSRAR